MSKPWIHAQSSARRYGGKPEDYIEVHSFLDSSKAAIADQRHRALTHNAWFIGHVLERVKFTNSCAATGDNRFTTLINSEGKHVSVRDIGEDHMTEDFHGFIPSAQDYLSEMAITDWMCNGKGEPPSFAEIRKHRERKRKATSRAPKSPLSDVTFDGGPRAVPSEVLDGGRRILPFRDGGAESEPISLYNTPPELLAPMLFKPEEPPPDGYEYCRDVDGVARGVRPIRKPDHLLD